VQPVEETLRPGLTQARKSIDDTDAFGSEEGGNPLLRDRGRRARPDLVRVGQDHDVHGGSVGPHVRGELADLREEDSRNPTPRPRLRLDEELVHAPDLPPFRIGHAPHERGSLEQLDQPRGRRGEVVVQVLHVVQDHGQHDGVRAIAAGDALVGVALLPRGPSGQGDAQHLHSRPARVHEVLQGLGPRLGAREAVPERDAVAEAGHAIRPRRLLDGMGAVAQAVAVEVLAERPAHRLRLHDVEIALPLRLPIEAARVRERARPRRRLEPACEPLAGAEKGHGHADAQRQVQEQRAARMGIGGGEDGIGAHGRR
jgi:hypothetical protein